MTKKLTRAERYKKNYDAIRNKTADPKLARKARTWSDKKIYEELGVKIPKKAPRLKPLPRDKKDLHKLQTRKTRLLKKYIYGRSIGLTAEEANRVRRYKKEKIASTRQYKQQKKLSFRKYQNITNKEKRLDLWSDWSKDDNLPPEVHRIAKEINSETSNKSGRLDDTDKYGYAVAFYMFIENQTAEEVLEYLKVDRYDGNRYIEVVRSV